MSAQLESDDKATVIKPVAEVEGKRRKDREAQTPLDEMEIAKELPIMPLPDTVIYPHIVAPLLVTDDNLIKLIDEALVGDRVIGVVTLRDSEQEPEPENLYDVGSAVAIARMFKLPDGQMQLLVQGVARIRIKDYTQTHPFLKASVERLVDKVEDTVELEALTRNALNLFRKIVNFAPYLPDELFIAAMNVDEPNDLSDFLSANINMSTAEKQELLEQLDVKERLKRLTVFLNREVEVLE
ncbi:MAG: LON peptidase substrate-binding domain-containing protein, partial [Actinobacteria bacterium]|nr:LON peptidase substrate-binding domain-containing protein [Actinomycetota bacterium]